jgi:hypothetical protein
MCFRPRGSGSRELPDSDVGKTLTGARHAWRKRAAAEVVAPDVPGLVFLRARSSSRMRPAWDIAMIFLLLGGFTTITIGFSLGLNWSTRKW